MIGVINYMQKKYFITIITLLLLAPISYAKAASENIFYYFPHTEAYKSVEKNYKKIDILAPQIYTVGQDLKLGGPESTDILALAKKKKLKVMPLVVQKNFSKVLMSDILQTPEAQDKIIEDMIAEAKKHHYIGWQFDFENINHLDRELYVDFVEKASKAFDKKNLKFSVAVIPRSTDYNPDSDNQDWSSGYDIGEISKHVDFVSMMSYDDPKSTGPVASLPYLQGVIKHTLKDTPANKISLGVPFYCWQWEAGNPKKIANISYDRAAETQEKYKKNGVFKQYIKDYAAEVFVFVKDDNTINLAWCDNAESIKTKLNIVNKEGFRGISAWALGQEDPKIWKVLK